MINILLYTKVTVKYIYKKVANESAWKTTYGFRYGEIS